MKSFTEAAYSTIFLVTWIIGIVLAKGFWSTFFTIIMPPYGWYLIIEKILQSYGVV